MTPDSHAFPTRPYDLVKEFVIALGDQVADQSILGVPAAGHSRRSSPVTITVGRSTSSAR